MPCWKRDFIQVADESLRIDRYSISLPVSHTGNLEDLVIFALQNERHERAHGVLAFPHYDIVYLRLLQHAFWLVRGMPAADNYFARGQGLFNHFSHFETFSVCRRTAGYTHYLRV